MMTSPKLVTLVPLNQQSNVFKKTNKTHKPINLARKEEEMIPSLPFNLSLPVRKISCDVSALEPFHFQGSCTMLSQAANNKPSNKITAE